MRNKTIVLMLAIVLVAGIAGLGFMALQEPDSDSTNQLNNSIADNTDNDTTVTEGGLDNDSHDASGQFVAYDPSLLSNAEDGDVVLFFSAGWCPTCRAFKADLTENLQNIPPDLTILELDFDTELDLRQQYGVTYQHTYVQVDADGNELKQWSASPTLEYMVMEVV